MMLFYACTIFFTVMCDSFPLYSEYSTNVGTVLFSSRDLDKQQWGKNEVGLLIARKYFQDLLPPPMFINCFNEDQVSILLGYFRDAYAAIKKEAEDPEEDTILTTALSDAVGGYFKEWILPIAKLDYYGGTISQANVIKLFQFYNEIKRYLDTNGEGWRKPDDRVLNTITINVAPPQLVTYTRSMRDPCELLAYFERTSTGLSIPIPSVSWNNKWSFMFVPLKNASLIPMNSPDLSQNLLKYYNAARSCIQSINPKDQKKFDEKFQSWLIDDVVPHLKDDNLYLALGSVLSLINTTRNIFTPNILDIYLDKFESNPRTMSAICKPSVIEISNKKLWIIVIILLIEVAWCVPALIYILCSKKFKKKERDCSSNFYFFIGNTKNKCSGEAPTLDVEIDTSCCIGDATTVDTNTVKILNESQLNNAEFTGQYPSCTTHSVGTTCPQTSTKGKPKIQSTNSMKYAPNEPKTFERNVSKNTFPKKSSIMTAQQQFSSTQMTLSSHEMSGAKLSGVSYSSHLKQCNPPPLENHQKSRKRHSEYTIEGKSHEDLKRTDDRRKRNERRQSVDHKKSETCRHAEECKKLEERRQAEQNEINQEHGELEESKKSKESRLAEDYGTYEEHNQDEEYWYPEDHKQAEENWDHQECMQEGCRKLEDRKRVEEYWKIEEQRQVEECKIPEERRQSAKRTKKKVKLETHKPTKRIEELRKSKEYYDPEESRKLEELKQAEECKKLKERKQAEENKKLEERKQADECKKVKELRQAEENKKLEERRRAEENKKLEERRQAERNKKLEERRQAEECKKHEERKQAEEKRKLKELAEENRKLEERKQAEKCRKLQECKQAEENKKLEERKLAEENRKLKQAEECRKLQERKQAEENKKLEERKLAEENRKLEELKNAEECRKLKERKQAEENKKLEERKLAEENKKLKQPEECKKIKERKQAEECRKLKERKQAEECRKLRERKLAEEAKKLEESRQAEENRTLEELRQPQECRSLYKIEESKNADNSKKLKEHKQLDELKKLDELRKLNECRRLQDRINHEEYRRRKKAELNSNLEELRELDEYRVYKYKDMDENLIESREFETYSEIYDNPEPALTRKCDRSCLNTVNASAVHEVNYAKLAEHKTDDSDKTISCSRQDDFQETDSPSQIDPYTCTGTRFENVVYENVSQYDVSSECRMSDNNLRDLLKRQGEKKAKHFQVSTESITRSRKDSKICFEQPFLEITIDRPGTEISVDMSQCRTHTPSRRPSKIPKLAACTLHHTSTYILGKQPVLGGGGEKHRSLIPQLKKKTADDMDLPQSSFSKKNKFNVTF